MIILQNEGGSQNFSAGQFGYVPNIESAARDRAGESGGAVHAAAVVPCTERQAGGIGKSGGAACTI
jgi:hypothetical protein